MGICCILSHVRLDLQNTLLRAGCLFSLFTQPMHSVAFYTHDLPHILAIVFQVILLSSPSELHLRDVSRKLNSY